MKRSEMIQHIQDLVYMSSPADLCLSYEQADSILSGLERYGMSPPIYYKNEGQSSFPPDGISCAFVEWEPEDDDADNYCGAV